jgi:hypothetical protein
MQRGVVDQRRRQRASRPFFVGESAFYSRVNFAEKDLKRTRGAYKTCTQAVVSRPRAGPIVDLGRVSETRADLEKIDGFFIG